jgi:hypothetical protein
VPNWLIVWQTHNAILRGPRERIDLKKCTGADDNFG